MTYKEFEAWCNERAADGCWGSSEAIICISTYTKLRQIPFWKRNKAWKEEFEKEIVETIIQPINQKILKVKENV